MKEIQLRRIGLGLSQAELAKAMNVEVSTVAKWETGSSYPRAKLFPKLADTLGCSIDELFGREKRG